MARSGRTTADLYCAVALPVRESERKRVLQQEDSWHADRRLVHQAILRRALDDARAFADAHAMLGAGLTRTAPAVFAMRGNTACGKTRALRSTLVPELIEPIKATEGRRHRSLNPDNFKLDLREWEPTRGLTSAEVHEESSVLAHWFLRQLASLVTSAGVLGSILIDRRLGTPEDVDELQRFARATARRFVLIDVDAPLRDSLAGVLARQPGGDDPIPPFEVIANGFAEARGHRWEVLASVAADPNSSGVIFATNSDGEKIKVAEIAAVPPGALPVDPLDRIEILDEPRFEAVVESTRVATAEIDRLRNELITADLIRTITEPLGSYSGTLSAALEPHQGATWATAVDTWSLRRAARLRGGAWPWITILILGIAVSIGVYLIAFR